MFVDEEILGVRVKDRIQEESLELENLLHVLPLISDYTRRT